MAAAARNGFAILVSGVAMSLEPIDVAVDRASKEPPLITDDTLVEFEDENEDEDDSESKISVNV
jgi:hypothetical protein